MNKFFSSFTHNAVSSSSSSDEETGAFLWKRKRQQGSPPKPKFQNHTRHCGSKCGEDCPCRYELDDFEVVKTLGTGTFATVQLVRHGLSGRYFAMKVMDKTRVIRMKQIEHVYSEKNILLELQTPFVVTVYRTYRDARRLYILMDFVRGGELFFHLRNAGHFGLQAAVFYGAEVLVALAGLHAQGIVYRDLKPENILLDAAGHVCLTDFGFAKQVGNRTWTMCGTPEYLAPEVIKSTGHDSAADWWSYGVLLYEMLAGYPPFQGDSPFETYELILRSPLTFPPDFDPAAADLIARLLQRDHARRLGCLRAGPADIQHHPFFRSIASWTDVAARRLQPPYVPRLSASPADTQNFEDYPTSPDTTSNNNNNTPRFITQPSPSSIDIFDDF